MATLILKPRIKMIDCETNKVIDIFDVDDILNSMFINQSIREDIIYNLNISFGDSNLVVFDGDILFEAIQESGADYSHINNIQEYLIEKQIGIFSAE